MNEESGPKAAPRTPAKKSKAKVTTRRWTDVAPNDPPADHLDPGYRDAIDALVETGELVEVDR